MTLKSLKIILYYIINYTVASLKAVFNISLKNIFAYKILSPQVRYRYVSCIKNTNAEKRPDKQNVLMLNSPDKICII